MTPIEDFLAIARQKTLTDENEQKFYSIGNVILKSLVKQLKLTKAKIDKCRLVHTSICVDLTPQDRFTFQWVDCKLGESYYEYWDDLKNLEELAKRIQIRTKTEQFYLATKATSKSRTNVPINHGLVDITDDGWFDGMPIEDYGSYIFQKEPLPTDPVQLEQLFLEINGEEPKKIKYNLTPGEQFHQLKTQFRAYFQCELIDFLDMAGFDIIKFDKFVGPVDGTSLKDTLLKKHGKGAVQLIEDIIAFKKGF